MTSLFRSTQDRKDGKGKWNQGANLKMRMVVAPALGDAVRLARALLGVVGE